jgi:hypothetical protein
MLMPKAYEAMRDRMASKGMDYDEAQKHAAMIYNSTHAKKMGGGDHEATARRRHKAKKALGGYK